MDGWMSRGAVIQWPSISHKCNFSIKDAHQQLLLIQAEWVIIIIIIINSE